MSNKREIRIKQIRLDDLRSVASNHIMIAQQTGKDSNYVKTMLRTYCLETWHLSQNSITNYVFITLADSKLAPRLETLNSGEVKEPMKPSIPAFIIPHTHTNII